MKNLNYKHFTMKRKHFLKSVIGASAFLGIPFNSFSSDRYSIQELIDNTEKEVKGSMFGFADSPIEKVRVGIIGLGTIGKSLVKLVKGFDLKILAYDLERDNVFSKKYNISYAELDYLLKDSDIVSIHLNYSNDLKNFINYEKIEMMKSNAIIINTSRGEIINETDLEIALKNNILAGAGLDVFNEEPYSGNLKKYDNVLMTPHIGSYAKEIRIKMELEAVENLILGLKNE